MDDQPDSGDTVQEIGEHDYYCNHCGKVVQRKSTKTWIRSYCDDIGGFTRLWRVPTDGG